LYNVRSYQNRHGKRYYYFRSDPEIALEGEAGSPEFYAHYASLLKSFKEGTLGADHAIAMPGSIADVILQYKQSTISNRHFTGFMKLAESSQGNYRRALDTIQEKSGFHQIGSVTKNGMQGFRNTLLKEGYAKSAIDECLMVFSVLWQFASELYEPRQDLGPNPTTGVWRVKDDTESHKRWPLPVIWSVYDANNRVMKLTLVLLLYTGQREIDVIKMRWDDIQERTVRGVKCWMVHVVQQKTGTKVWLPLHPRLKEELDRTPRINDFILNTNRRTPFTRTSSISGTIRNALKNAEEAVPNYRDYSGHGLRVSAACELLEAGNDIKVVAAITGHKDIKVLLKYLAEIDQERLAMKAIDTWAASAVGA
jgi:integrase